MRYGQHLAQVSPTLCIIRFYPREQAIRCFLVKSRPMEDWVLMEVPMPWARVDGKSDESCLFIFVIYSPPFLFSVLLFETW